MKLFVLMTIILNLVAMHIIEDAGECIVNVRGCEAVSVMSWSCTQGTRTVSGGPGTRRRTAARPVVGEHSL